MNYKTGFKFKPTFLSNIDFFEITDFKEDTNDIVVEVHHRNGVTLTDYIRKDYYDEAFKLGEYKEV